MKFDARKVLVTTVKLFAASLVVGWILSLVEVDPLGFIRLLSQSVHGVANIIADFVRWSIPYITLGAVIVIPFYLIRLGLGLLKRKRNRQ